MAKIQVELGGKYTLGDTITKAQNDMKKFGRDTKDAGSIATTALKGVADVAGKDASKAINGLTNVVSGLATGGLFGMVAAAAGTAFSFIKDQMEKAKEAAKKLGEAFEQSLIVAVKRITDGVVQQGKEVDEGKKKIEELIKVANGAAASDAKIKIAELHIQTLQKITDDMSEAGVKALKAQEAYEAFIIKSHAQTAAINEEERLCKVRRMEVEKQITDLNATLFDLVGEESEWRKKNSYELIRYEGLLRSASNTVDDMVKAGVKESEAIKFHAIRLAEKVEFEEKNKAFVAEYNARIKGAADAEALKTKLLEEQHQLDLRIAQAEQQLEVALKEGTATEKELGQAARIAQQAYTKEVEAKQIATILQQEESALRLDIANRMAKLKLTQEEQDRLMEVLNEGLEEELEEQEIRDNIEREYRKIREEQNKLLEESNEQQKKDNQDKKNGKKQDINFSGTFGVNISNTSEQANEIGKEVKDKLKIPKEEEMKRAQERAGRNIWTAEKFNSTWFNKFMQEYQTGKMSEDQKKKGIEMLKAQQKNWTEEAGKAAAKSFKIKDGSPLSLVDALKHQEVSTRMMSGQEKQKFLSAVEKLKNEMDQADREKATKKRKEDEMYSDIGKIASAVKEMGLK